MASVRGVISVQRFEEIEPELASDCREFVEKASSFVRSHRWCVALTDIQVGAVFPGIIGIFAARVVPARDDIPEWHWLVVGDVPSAYISVDDTANPAEALDSYIGAMEEWIAAVRSGADLHDVYPVDAPPTMLNADSLATRLAFLDERVLPILRENQWG